MKPCHTTVYETNGPIGEARLVVTGNEPNFTAYGGYHDAGDADRRTYHMDVTATLLTTYEAFPDLFHRRPVQHPGQVRRPVQHPGQGQRDSRHHRRGRMGRDVLGIHAGAFRRDPLGHRDASGIRPSRPTTRRPNVSAPRCSIRGRRDSPPGCSCTWPASSNPTSPSAAKNCRNMRKWPSRGRRPHSHHA